MSKFFFYFIFKYIKIDIDKIYDFKKQNSMISNYHDCLRLNFYQNLKINGC